MLGSRQIRTFERDGEGDRLGRLPQLRPPAAVVAGSSRWVSVGQGHVWAELFAVLALVPPRIGVGTQDGLVDAEAAA
jgi:hypothetical protein